MTARTKEEVIDRMVELKNAGYTVRQIAEILQCSYNNVRFYLVKRGIELPNTGRRIECTEEYAKLASEMRMKGVIWEVVAGKIGFDRYTLNRAMKRYGYV